MGSCFSADETPVTDAGPQRRNRSNRGDRRLTRQPAIGKNQPLKQDIPKWKSEVALTEGQLASKRDEFWDTAPAFEGRKEIWDALKAAAYACETADYDLAQAIINGASITIPTGYLTDCYDELGNRYQLPVYVLSPPTNLQLETKDVEGTDSDNENEGEDIVLKLRLSTNKDLKLTAKTTHTVGKIKHMLAQAEKLNPRQRWFFGGKMLSDRQKIGDARIPKGHMIQVILPIEEDSDLTGPTPVSP